MNIYSVDIRYKGEQEFETLYSCEDEWICSEFFESITAEPHMRKIMAEVALNYTKYDDNWLVIDGIEKNYWRSNDE